MRCRRRTVQTTCLLRGDQNHRASAGPVDRSGTAAVSLDPHPVCQMAAQQMQLCCRSFVFLRHSLSLREGGGKEVSSLLQSRVPHSAIETNGRTQGCVSCAELSFFSSSLEVVYFLSVGISGTEPSLGRMFRTFSDSLCCCIKG